MGKSNKNLREGLALWVAGDQPFGMMKDECGMMKAPARSREKERE